MRLRFLGAATTVTGSQFLLTTDRARVLIDCGLFQGSPSEASRNREPLPYDAQRIDAIVLTHAHLDHCGFLPVVVRDGFHGPAYATRASVELVSLVLLDSGKVQQEQARMQRRRRKRHEREEARHAAERAEQERRAAAAARAAEADAHAGTAAHGGDLEHAIRRHGPELVTQPVEPLYTVAEAETAIERLRGVDYERPFTVAPGITCTLHDAGHILGSAIVVLDVEEGGRSTRLVFSGDLGRPGTPILRDPTAILDGADYVLVESTYGGREHEPSDEARRLLADAVNTVASGHGVLLVPAFAIGRTQEIVWELDRMVSAGTIPRLPLYLDSPMASAASDIYHRYPGYYDEETHRLLEAGETPLDYPGQVVTADTDASRAIAEQPRPMMIVASSGMLTGGRVVAHLRDLIDDPAALLLFVGYQGEGTLGAHLQAGAKTVHLDGEERAVRCQVRSISGFSAHADESELLDWLRHFADAPRRPRRVFLVHGDPDAVDALEPKVRALGLETARPRWREEVELT
ncbi:MAG: MBL fold metallo-hydrolase RNA specificity domain-containing protein [Chloroflexota bacterium]